MYSFCPNGSQDIFQTPQRRVDSRQRISPRSKTDHDYNEDYERSTTATLIHSSPGTYKEDETSNKSSAHGYTSGHDPHYYPNNDEGFNQAHTQSHSNPSSYILSPRTQPHNDPGCKFLRHPTIAFGIKDSDISNNGENSTASGSSQVKFLYQPKIISTKGSMKFPKFFFVFEFASKEDEEWLDDIPIQLFKDPIGRQSERRSDSVQVISKTCFFQDVKYWLQASLLLSILGPLPRKKDQDSKILVKHYNITKKAQERCVLDIENSAKTRKACLIPLTNVAGEVTIDVNNPDATFSWVKGFAILVEYQLGAGLQVVFGGGALDHSGLFIVLI